CLRRGLGQLFHRRWRDHLVERRGERDPRREHHALAAEAEGAEGAGGAGGAGGDRWLRRRAHDHHQQLHDDRGGDRARAAARHPRSPRGDRRALLHDPWKAEELMERPRAIGGSDAAVVLGISPWKTRYQLWRELVGESEPVAEENERLRWGKLLEEPVAREYAERTGRKIRRVNRTLVHPELPYVTGHLDRDVVRGDDPEKRILEVKTTDTWNRTEWGPSGSDEVPDHYLTQVQHYMALTGADICDVAVLVGGNDFRVLHVPRNDRLIGAMLERYVDFWERHVEAKVPPEVETLGDAKTR